MEKLIIIIKTERSGELAQIEQGLWGGYFCSQFCWIRSDFDLNFSLVYLLYYKMQCLMWNSRSFLTNY